VRVSNAAKRVLPDVRCRRCAATAITHEAWNAAQADAVAHRSAYQQACDKARWSERLAVQRAQAAEKWCLELHADSKCIIPANKSDEFHKFCAELIENNNKMVKEKLNELLKRN
jgi:hypothetical protein